jgi:hypothetical protein
MTITHPEVIISDAIAKAIKPFKTELATAAKLDVELADKADSYHEDKVKPAAAELLHRATTDDSALAEIEAAGGLDAWIAARCAMHLPHENRRERHATDSAALLEKMAGAIVPALESAREKIQKQFETVMSELGELPGGLSQWDANIRNQRNGIEAAAKHAQRGVGPAWILGQLGLLKHLE